MIAPSAAEEPNMDPVVLAVFVLVYAGMILGRIPGLALDRTGVALLGAVALLITGRISPTEARNAVDVPTLGLLFGLMVVSAQFRLGGAYAAITRRIALAPQAPRTLLAWVILVSGALSAVLANDVVCLAVAPLLIEACARRGLHPLPFLMALACAANVGSAATLIGNPQNMLIGQTLHLSFGGYLMDGGVPALLGLGVVWWVIQAQWQGRWEKSLPIPTVEAPQFDSWQTMKGSAIVMALLAVFLCSSWPRDVVALAAGGFMLLSRRMHSRHMLGQVDWQLLVLFVGLFILHRAMETSGTLFAVWDGAGSMGIGVSHPAALFTVTVVLSNLVSNVPAVMMLLPAAEHPLAGPILALASTLAGNLIIVGSIANIIVVDQAERLHVTIHWREHASVGVPVTVATLGLAAVWLWMRAP